MHANHNLCCLNDQVLQPNALSDTINHVSLLFFHARGNACGSIINYGFVGFSV
jgi:hypothetical protein